MSERADVCAFSGELRIICVRTYLNIMLSTCVCINICRATYGRVCLCVCVTMCSLLCVCVDIFMHFLSGDFYSATRFLLNVILSFTISCVYTVLADVSLSVGDCGEESVHSILKNGKIRLSALKVIPFSIRKRKFE